MRKVTSWRPRRPISRALTAGSRDGSLLGKRRVASHAEERDYAPFARSLLFKLGYAVLPAGDLPDPELRIVREDRLADLAQLPPLPLIVLTDRREPGSGDARVIVSICGQCHLRGGRSRSTGLPFPNNFIAGDNLFQDFEADFGLAGDTEFHSADRHIYENVRDVAVLGESRVTCLSCHLVHGDSGNRHRRVLRNERCFTCHERAEKIAPPKATAVHSGTCEY